MHAVAIFPPPAQAPRRDAPLLRALARALADLGDIELPDSAPTEEDARNLEAVSYTHLTLPTN